MHRPLTWPCFQHSLKIFQLLLLLGSCRQRRRPSHSHVWEVWGSSTLRPITPSLRVTLLDSVPSIVPVARRPSAFLFSTTEAMMWSRMVGKPPFALSACQKEEINLITSKFNYAVSIEMCFCPSQFFMHFFISYRTILKFVIT